MSSSSSTWAPDAAPTLQIHPFWRKSTHHQKLFELFRKHGIAVFVVGGAVRDTLTFHKIPQKADLDLCTPMEPLEINNRLQKCTDIKILTYAQKFGTLVLTYQSKSYELTSFRQDIETDGRYAKVIFTRSMCKDSKRRDFTINALYSDPLGHIYDPTNKGIRDLKQGKVRFIGLFQERLNEDHLRLLRLFRFQTIFGKKPLPSSYLKLAKKNAPCLNTLSRERRWQEMKKILSAPKSYSTLKIMNRLGIVSFSFAASINITNNVSRLKLFFKMGFNKAYPWVVMAYLGADSSTLPLTKKEKKTFDAFKLHLPLYQNVKSLSRWKKLLNTFTPQEVACLASLCFSKKRTLKKLISSLRQLDNKIVPLNSTDIQQHLALEPGPDLGKALHKAKDLWLERGGLITKAEILASL